MSKKGKAEKFSKLLARRNLIYERLHLALPENVTAVQRACDRTVRKRGHKVYRNDRDRCERFLTKLFKKYNLRKTTSEQFWWLSCLCQLIGPSPDVLRTAKTLEYKQKRRPKSSKDLTKRKHKKKWKVKRNRR